MHAAAVRLELRIPGVRSLKGKRRVIRALTARLVGTFPVAVAEVGHQDAWQRATLGVALVSGEVSHVRSIIDAIHRVVLDDLEVELIEMGVAWLEESP
jgi:uncharacterized protein YlxP (DUF503 family)